MPSIRYVEMSEPDYDVISKRIRASYPNSCICWIEEVVNPSLRKAYEARRALLLSGGGGPNSEQLLFHGTSEEAVNNIAAGGFDPAYNKTSAYGKGTYFAKNASYSLNYMKSEKNGISFMFLCDVLVGNSCLGSSNMIINTSLYDSSVDNAANPTIFVTQYADGAYPKYIIAFHKNAPR
jgi:hypothetical protein